MTVRADSGFWSWKLCDRLDAHGIAWSITVRLHANMKAAIAAIDEAAWVDIDYTIGGQAQVAETTYTAGRGNEAAHGSSRRAPHPPGRTRATPALARLAPPRLHHSTPKVSMIAADRFHREHAVVELAIRDLKEGAGLDHIPSGHYHANAAWLACAVLAHNLGCWTTLLAGQPPVTNRTRRTRLISVPAVIVNRSGRTLLRLPARWPWAPAFTTTLNALRALPAPSG